MTLREAPGKLGVRGTPPMAYLLRMSVAAAALFAGATLTQAQVTHPLHPTGFEPGGEPTILAQAQRGETSGPADRGNVQPPTAVEKQYEGRSRAPENGNPAAGMPGVEGKPGTESGEVPRGAPPFKK